MKKTKTSPVPQSGFSKKKFTVYCGGTIVKRTDLEPEAEKKIEELKARNEPDFTLINNATGGKTHYYKEAYQRNYRCTITKGELPAG